MKEGKKRHLLGERGWLQAADLHVVYLLVSVIPAASLDPNKDTKIDSILESLKSEFLDILQQCTGTIQFTIYKVERS